MQKIIHLSEGTLTINFAVDPADLQLFAARKMLEDPVTVIYQPSEMEHIERSMAYLKIHTNTIIETIKLELSKFPEFYDHVEVEYRDFFVDQMPVNRPGRRTRGSYELDIKVTYPH